MRTVNYPMLWLVLLIAFAGIEGATAGLISIWFCAGSLVALFSAWLGAGLMVQIGLFAIVSILTMAILRPMAGKWIQPAPEKTNADRILDADAMVIETINNIEASGQIKVGGAIWTARSADGEVIPVGTLVRVERIEGVKAMVTPMEKGTV